MKGPEVTTERQPTNEKQPTIYGIVRTEFAEHPILIEHGGPRYMAMNFPDAQSYYGVSEAMAIFVRLGLRREDKDNGTLYVWHYAEPIFGDEAATIQRGDIYAQFLLTEADISGDPQAVVNCVCRGEDTPHLRGIPFCKHEGEPEQVDEEWHFRELMELKTNQVRHIARDNGVVYWNNIPKTRLAMLMCASVEQDRECPDCGNSLGSPHSPICTVAICLKTGKLRYRCTGEHTGEIGTNYCGMDRWIGFTPGVIESFAYGCTPEEAIASGTWSVEEQVYLLPFDQMDIEETDPQFEPEATDTPNLDDILKRTLDGAKEAMAEDPILQQMQDKIQDDAELRRGEGIGNFKPTGPLRPKPKMRNVDPTGWTEPCDGVCGDESPHDSHLTDKARRDLKLYDEDSQTDSLGLNPYIRAELHKSSAEELRTKDQENEFHETFSDAEKPVMPAPQGRPTSDEVSGSSDQHSGGNEDS
jgi:hypothetical protein